MIIKIAVVLLGIMVFIGACCACDNPSLIIPKGKGGTK